MKKYLTLARTALSRGITYRFTIMAYRVGEIFEVLFLILMWTAIYRDHSSVNGYTLEQMITYVLVGNMVRVLTRNFLEEHIGMEIKNGTLSLFLVKPMSYLRYCMVRESGRVVLPGLVSVASQVVVIFFFLNRFLSPSSVAHLAVAIAMIFLSFILELLLSFLVGLVALWTDEVAGLYSTIERVRKFLAGGYFPISLLPPMYGTVSFFLPFAYSFFLPTQLYLGKVTWQKGIQGLGIQLIWIMLLYIIIRLVWRRGIRRYEGIGI